MPAEVQFATDRTPDTAAYAALYGSTFSTSEGSDEGLVIADLVTRLLQTTAAADIHIFSAQADNKLCAAAIFSRLLYADDARSVFILSPMAVATEYQGNGFGQGLIRHALDALRRAGVDAAFTYGDPAFYGKTGFQPMGVDTAPPPLPLSQPIGWIGQMLDGSEMTSFKGACSCVPALNDPAIW